MRRLSSLRLDMIRVGIRATLVSVPSSRRASAVRAASGPISIITLGRPSETRRRRPCSNSTGLLTFLAQYPASSLPSINSPVTRETNLAALGALKAMSRMDSRKAGSAGSMADEWNA